MKGGGLGGERRTVGLGLCQSGAAAKEPLSGAGGEPEQQLIVAKDASPQLGDSLTPPPPPAGTLVLCHEARPLQQTSAAVTNEPPASSRRDCGIFAAQP